MRHLYVKEKGDGGQNQIQHICRDGGQTDVNGDCAILKPPTMVLVPFWKHTSDPTTLRNASLLSPAAGVGSRVLKFVILAEAKRTSPSVHHLKGESSDVSIDALRALHKLKYYFTYCHFKFQVYLTSITTHIKNILFDDSLGRSVRKSKSPQKHLSRWSYDSTNARWYLLVNSDDPRPHRSDTSTSCPSKVQNVGTTLLTLLEEEILI